MTATNRVSPFEAGLEELGPGSHVCSITEGELEHLAVGVPYVRIGLERGEKCIYITDEGKEQRLRKAFRDGGIDVGAAVASNALVLMTSAQAYLKQDSFDPYRMLSWWKKLTGAAQQEGFTALRGAAEMQWLLRGAPGSLRWLEYERQLTQFSADTNCLLLCQYQRPPFSADLLLNAIRMHPCVIHRSTIAQNIYHIPLEEPAEIELHATELERLLADIRKREQIRRKREQDRRRIERRLNIALSSSTVAFTNLRALRDAAGRIIDFSWQYANPEALRILGHGADALIGHPVREVIPDAWEPSGLFECFVQVAETGEQAVIEAGFTRDGISRSWQNIVTKLDDGVAVWFPEITERKTAEEELRRSAAYLADGQKISHTGSWAWDVASQEISFWSFEHFCIVGLDPNVKPTYALMRAMIHPDDVSVIEQNFARAIREQVEFDNEYRIWRADGMLRNIHTFGHPVFDEGGTLVEYVGTILDCTEQKQAEAALRATQAELARASRLTTLGELTASIAHEVNQPLAGIIAHGAAARRWLGRAILNVDEAERAIDGIVADAHRASEVIARIRSLAARADNPREPLDLHDLIRDVVALTRGELHQHNAVLRTEFASSLALARVLGDRVQLQQVVLNLIMNALDAVSALTEGPREIVIQTSLSDHHDLLTAVRDSGVGFSEEGLRRIFEPFYTTKPHGMGIGLSISRSIVEAHSGRLWAARNDNAPGATIAFMLPLHEPPHG